MKKYPKTISILDAARALNCFTGTIACKLGIKPAIGNEQVAFSKVAESFKVSPEILADLVLQNDRALTREQAAALLGIKTHSLNTIKRSRSTIVPVVNIGLGRGAGLRYSRKAIEAHLAFQKQPQNEIGGAA